MSFLIVICFLFVYLFYIVVYPGVDLSIEPTFERITVCKLQEFLQVLNLKPQVDYFSLSVHIEFSQNTLPPEKKSLKIEILFLKRFIIILSFLWPCPVNTLGENRLPQWRILDYFINWFLFVGLISLKRTLYSTRVWSLFCLDL